MGKWAARLAADFSVHPPEDTRQNRQNPLLSGLSGTPEGCAEIFEAGPQAMADEAPASPIDCKRCTGRARHGNCTRPEAAGLIPAGVGFGIAWAPEGHAGDCPAFDPAPVPDARPYRLDRIEGDAAHAAAWDDECIERFELRVMALRRRGFVELDAEDLAERMHLADVEQDDRGRCIQCAHLAGSVPTGWRCKAAGMAGVVNPLPLALVTLGQRCGGFDLAAPAGSFRMHCGEGSSSLQAALVRARGQGEQ